MALTPTEREEHFFKAMVDAADGSTPEELEPTERKEHWYKEIIDAIKAGGGGSGGGVLVVKFAYANGTSTCDHTFAEIHAAVTAGNPVIGYVVDCDGVYRSFRHLNGREGQKARYVLNPGNVYSSSGLKTVNAEINEDNAVTVTVQELII